jgi:HSP20 family molecular chaperone IbpA
MASSITPANDRAALADQYRSQKAERDELAQTHEAEVENLKKNYSAEKANLEDRFEQGLQEDKLAHYDHLRNVKSQMNREDMTLEHARNEVITQKQAELSKSTIQADQTGKAELTTIQEKYAAAEEFERNRGQLASEETRTNHHKNAELIMKDSEKAEADLRNQKMTELTRHKEDHATALTEMASHYENLRGQVQQGYKGELDAVRQQANDELNHTRLTNAVWLKQYSDRANDPFYKMGRFQSNLVDQGDAYKLRVKVPEYERNQFKVQIAGQEIQLSGTRTNSEKAEVEPGRWISTSSNQNVSERFTLEEAVDPKSMSMKQDGEWLEYRIPKYSARRHEREIADGKLADQQDATLVKELDFPNSLPKPTVARVNGKMEKGNA